MSSSAVIPAWASAVSTDWASGVLGPAAEELEAEAGEPDEADGGDGDGDLRDGDEPPTVPDVRTVLFPAGLELMSPIPRKKSSIPISHSLHGRVAGSAYTV
jgi:hypothetical protein